LNEGGGPSAPPSVRRGRWRGTRASGTNPRALAAAEAAAARRSPPEPDHPLWPTFRAQGVDPTTFGRWIPQLKFRVEEGVTQVLAPTRFHADHVQGEYRHILEAATGTPVRFNAILTARKS
jgi:hypothetical protein